MRAATRGSALARRQTSIVAGLLAEACGAVVEPVVVSTTGDRQPDDPIHAMGGKGVFVKEVQAAVLDGRADVAVHSAKDLPSSTPEGLVLAAVPRRGDPRDALVGCRLADLPVGATVATGSVRRKAQLAWMRSDLSFAELRGNIATRLNKASGFDAIVMAAVALQRLGLGPDVLDVLEPDVLVPQVGQGAIAVECRADDRAVLETLLATEHGPSRWAVDAERAFLAELGGDCSLPAGAHAVEAHGGGLELTGLVASLDGRMLIRDTRRGRDPETLGRSVARHLLDECGGRELMRAAG
ncbi:MAG: hydroxymethylbilane synthase [Acidimicrobiaceae bacterium]|nr:hydroxymethylbilane synthase [Acidimicrobiaceae bacterium]MYE97621.1 hydroxymethylbilane synthase [Acidimicrobiaceae bacterium]MYI53343.1 hydroxymethylbilane synthase [Acidimicrobiaceae bacterium]